MKNLLMLLLLFAAINLTAQDLPAVYNTGQPAAIIAVTDQRIYKDGEQLEIEAGTPIVAFYEKDLTFHIAGKRAYTTNYPFYLVAFAGQENVPDEEPVLKGVPLGDVVRIGISQGDAVFEIVPRKVSMMNGDGSWTTMPEVVASPMTFYKVEGFDMMHEPIDLLPSHFVIWREKQCPIFDKELAVNDFQANVLTHSIMTSPAIGKVKRYYLFNLKEITIAAIKVKYATSNYFEKEDADGNIYNNGYRWMYQLTDSDRERGYVSFRQYAGRYPECTMKSDPYAIVKYELVMLTEVPDNEDLEPPAPPPPPVVTPDIPEGFDLIAGNKYFSICVTAVEGKLAFVNHLNHSISIQLKEVDAPRGLVGMGIKANQYAVRDNLKFGDDKYKGKRYVVRFSSYQAGVYPAQFLEFDYEL